MGLDNYYISAEDSYTFTAICRCSVGKPRWTYYTDTSNGVIPIPDDDLYCLNGTEPCALTNIKEEAEIAGLFIYVKLENYTATKPTLLQCRNSHFNFAPGISVVITNTTAAKGKREPGEVLSCVGCMVTW